MGANMNLTIDSFLMMPKPRILALVISELSQKREDDPALGMSREEIGARWRFGLVSDSERSAALLWLCGAHGEGWEWDNRRGRAKS